MQGLISVIIPVYNHAEHLQEVLNALFRQSYGQFEVIIVDDGSERYLRKEDFQVAPNFRITWLRQDNKGAPAARNFGFNNSHGDYLLFLDADVIASVDMLEKLYIALEKNPQASYAYCDHYMGFKRIPSRNFDADALKKNNYIPTMSLIRRSDFPCFDESLRRFQDWDLWLTMLEHGNRGVYVSGFLWRAYPHHVGMSTWLPSRAYTFPFKYLPWFFGKVRAYEKAKRIVMAKHHLL